MCQVQRPVDITRKMLLGLFCGLMENGYSSWLHRVEDRSFAEGTVLEDYRKGGKFNKDEDDLWPTNYIVAFSPGCSLKLLVDNPNEGDDTLIFEWTLEKALAGIKIMAEKYPRHFHDIIIENDDADTADIFGQCVVYGEAVYG